MQGYSGRFGLLSLSTKDSSSHLKSVHARTHNPIFRPFPALLIGKDSLGANLMLVNVRDQSHAQHMQKVAYIN